MVAKIILKTVFVMISQKRCYIGLNVSRGYVRDGGEWRKEEGEQIAWLRGFPESNIFSIRTEGKCWILSSDPGYARNVIGYSTKRRRENIENIFYLKYQNL